MPVVVVANPKGGVGKSTLSTNVAAYYARQGHPVILGDTDRQQSARLWLGLRPPAARPIGAWDVSADEITKPPKGSSHAVLDTPAGLHGRREFGPALLVGGLQHGGIGALGIGVHRVGPADGQVQGDERGHHHDHRAADHQPHDAVLPPRPGMGRRCVGAD